MLFVSIAIVLLFLSYVYDICGFNRHKSAWSNIVLVIFIFYAGLKYHLGGDNYSYIHYFYDVYPDLGSYTWEDLAIGKDPLYALANSFIKALGGKFYVVQFAHAFVLNLLIFNYIKRHSHYFFACVFFYFITCYLHYNAEILRGSLSIVVCLYGNDFIKRNKWLKGYLLYGIALFLHAQTLLIFFMPLLFGMRLNFKGYLILFITFVLSYLLHDGLNEYLFVLDNLEDVQRKAELYINSEVYGAGNISIGGLIVYVIPILYVIFAVAYLKKRNRFSNLDEIEAFVFLGLLFTLLSFHLPIVYRFKDYYRIYFVILYGELFVGISKSHVILSAKNIRFVNSLICFLPFLVITTFSMTDKSAFIRYFPYTNIISKKIVIERERLYNDGSVTPSQY